MRKTMTTKNSKTSDNGLPPQLQSAISGAESALAKYDQFAAALAQTGAAIPAALSEEQRLYRELGAAEVSGDAVDSLRTRLDAAQSERQGHVRRRRAAAEGLLELEGELRNVRAAIDQARAAHASTIVADFNRRWSEACRALAALHSEARQLSQALESPISCPPPYAPILNVATDQWQVRFTGVLPEAPPMPAQLEAVTGAFNRLADALGLVGGIKQGAEQDARHAALSRVRAGMPATMTGVFQVTRAFTHMGVTFPVGALVDRSIFGDSALYRIELGRQVHRIEIGMAAEAA